MNLEEFKNKYEGKFVEYHSYSSGAENQCVDLANQWLVEGLNLKAIIGTNAADFPSKAVSMGMIWIPNTPDGIPNPGDLIVYEGEIGHIDIAYYGCTSTKVVAFSQNYPTGSPCVIRSSSYLRPKVIGWLHSEENMTSDEIAVKKTDFERMVAEGTAYKEILSKYNVADAQGLYNMIAGKDSWIKTIGDEKSKFQAQVENDVEIIKQLRDTIAIKNDDIDTLTDRLDTAGNTIVQLGKDKGTLAIEKAQLKTQLEACKQGSITQTSTIEQLISWFKNLWNKN